MAYEIVPATEATMAEVEAWLDVEESIYKTAIEAWEAGGYVGDGPPRGFRCNWDSVKRTWSEGNARVDILMVDGHAVGILDGTDILEIRPDLRREGYGRLLAVFMVDVAHNEGRSVLEIEIAPWTAEPSGSAWVSPSCPTVEAAAAEFTPTESSTRSTVFPTASGSPSPSSSIRSTSGTGKIRSLSLGFQVWANVCQTGASSCRAGILLRAYPQSARRLLRQHRARRRGDSLRQGQVRDEQGQRYPARCRLYVLHRPHHTAVLARLGLDLWR